MKIFNVHAKSMYYRYIRFWGVLMMAALLATTPSVAGIPPLNLLSLDNFVILAGSTITGIPPVSITGNIGLSPAAGSYITGFDGSNVVGNLYVVDASGPSGSTIDAALLTTAKGDLTTAYNDAANRTPVPTGTFLNPGAGNMGGMNLAAGLYKFTGAADITGADLTLTGNATDVWIFQIGTSLNLGSGIKIILAGGAQAANIFWQVGTSATLGTYSVFMGSILADQSISLATGATMDGRALAFSAAVTMGSGVTSNRAFLFPVFSADSLQSTFGNVSNFTSKIDTIRVKNTGGADLVITNVTSSDSQFTVSWTSATIMPDSVKQIYITYTPTGTGNQNANIIFTHNALKPKDTITATGTGVIPIFSANTYTLNFGNVRNNQTKMDSITVTNTGTANLMITSVTSTNARFTVTPTTDTIAPNGTRKFYITFAPLVDSAQAGKIIFTHNAAKPKDTINVTGTGVSPLFSATPMSLNFGNVRNELTKTDSVTVTNTGTDNLIISSITSSNVLFTVTPTTGTITPGASLKYYFTFAPLVDGAQSALMIFNHNAAKPKDTITMTGNGVSPFFAVSPDTLNFGNVRNLTTKMDSITVTNTGTSDLVITSVTASSTIFTITPTSGTLTPGASQKYYITFAPVADGFQQGTFTFNHNAKIPTNVYTVSGTGVSPIFSSSLPGLNFGNVRNGTTKLDSVMITNIGTSDLIIDSVTTSNPRYTVTPTTGTIIPGGTQKFYVTFAPLVDGSQTGFVYFNHNALNQKDSITLTGSGVSPKFASNVQSINFGNVRNGTTKMDSITVSNTGTSDLIIDSIVATNGVFTVTPLNATISQGLSQKFYVTFAPIVDGAASGFIIFSHNALVAKDSISVSGTGVSPMLAMNVQNVNFGNVRNGTSKQDSVIITNTGTSTLTISSVTSSNVKFTVTPTTSTLAPGATQKFYLTFSPTADGAQSGLIIFTDDADKPKDTITVSGTGVSPLFAVNPQVLNFGNVRNGTQKMDSVTVTNTGTTNLVISSVTSTNPLFTVTPSAVSTIAPGGSLKFYVSFSPLIDGLQNSFLVFNHDAAKPKDTVMLTGTGVSPMFYASTLVLNFGNVRTGTGKMDSVTITNTGTTSLTISNVTSSNSVFTATPLLGTIAPGASQKFYITFSPIVDGLQAGLIIFTDDAAKPRDTIFVTGTGISPQFSSSVQSIDFGNVRIGTSRVETISVTNTGTDNLIISGATSSNGVFGVTPITGTIAPGATQLFFISFSPMSNGTQSGTITFTHNASNVTDIINVTGTGVSPMFVASVQRLDFGNVGVGSGKVLTVSVTNAGTSDLVIYGVSSSNAQFSTSPLNATLAPGATQIFSVTFAPLTTGFHTGSVTFSHNGLNANDAIAVTGTGVLSSIAISTQSLDFGNVRTGTTKTLPVTVTNTGSGDLTISNITSSNAVFTFTPNGIILTPGMTQVYNVTFAPLVDGLQTGNLVLTHTASPTPSIITLRGVGVTPILSFGQQNLDFGNVVIATTKQLSVMITNAGTGDLNITSIVPNDTHYTITPTTGTILQGASQEFFVTFAPTVLGRVTSTITFNSTAGVSTLNVTGNGIDSMRVITIKAARELPIGTSFITEGVVTRTLGSYTRIQDSTGGLTLFHETGEFGLKALAPVVTMGDKIRVAGKITEKDNLKIITSSNLVSHSIISSSNPLPTPFKVTLSEIALRGEQYESCLIKVENLIMTSDGDLTFRESKIYQVTDSTDKANTVVIRIGLTADTHMDGMAIFERPVTFEGVLSQSSSCTTCGYQLTPVLQNDLRFAPVGIFNQSTGNEYFLSNNYPNPFNASTTIQYSIGTPDVVTLKVFTLAGQEVATLVNGFRDAGTHTVTFTEGDSSILLGSQMYYYRLEVGKFSQTKQMVFVK